MAITVHRPRVFLDVSIGEQHAGRLTVELFADHTPKTCENFRQLCTGERKGLTYSTVPFHCVIDEFMIQGGDIANGDGTGTASIYDGEFEDEALSWRDMDAAGLVCAANRGPDTNGSQFFITLEPCPHLNGKHTIFGRLVAGDDILQRIAKVAVDGKDRPIEPVLVSRCGELQRASQKPKAAATTGLSKSKEEKAAPTERGRRRKSNDSDDEMDDAEAAPVLTNGRPRRQSDNFVDEGIRGRPRLRSGSRSRSPAVVEEDEGSEEGEEQLSDRRASPERLHKRKRNPSPSRRADSGERRRRSLPNQYADRVERGYRDNDRYKPSPRRDSYRDSGRRGNCDNRYRPSRDRYPDDGRLSGDGRLGGGGGGGGYDEYEPPVKFKGRGAMKYREPERQW